MSRTRKITLSAVAVAVGSLVAASGAAATVADASATQPQSMARTFTYKNAVRGECLTGLKAEYPSVRVRQCDGTPKQNWFHDVSGENYTIRGQGIDNCLDGNGVAGGLVWMLACDGNDRQEWILRNHSGGYVSFENLERPGQCLDIDPDGLTDEVRLWNCNFGVSQRWLRE